ncbi:MAG: hypothetical protein IPK26_22595 [Planctomycetes bacterium]|nr:hypothetical protein [Planctomycetota bacterium]
MRPTRPQWFSTAPTALLACLCACGGGGGGGGTNLAPTIVSAAFTGAGPTPAAGDELLLFFSEAISVVSGKLLTDVDVTLSGGGSLGTVTAAPTQLNTTVLSIELGAGVTFTPDTTTIALATANDVVTDTTGKLGAAAAAVVIATSDGAVPTLSNVTIGAIDDALNGDGAAGGDLQVPQNGWTIDLVYADNGAVDTSRTRIQSSLDVGTSSGTQPAGTDLRPFLTTVSATTSTASYRVPGTVTFPAGPLTLTATVIDTTGLASTPVTFTASVRPWTDGIRPFETGVNATQVWFLDFTRDVESYTTSSGGGATAVNVVAGSSGTADFLEILQVLGLRSATPIANVSGSDDSNAVVVNLFKSALLAELGTLYDGANVTFTLTQPSGSFGSNSSLAYNAIAYSQICIAGAATDAGVLGVAIYDLQNDTQNNNCQTDFVGQRLGIFLHTIIENGMGSLASSTFRQTYDEFTAGNGGTPIGEDANDATSLQTILAGGSLSGRAADIDDAIADLARFTAVVLAHEAGHSMGLVANGAAPTGLFGNDDTNFPGSTDGHIRNTALFPGGSINVMSPVLTWSLAINSNTAFNSLNRAYLREQVSYGN